MVYRYLAPIVALLSATAFTACQEKYENASTAPSASESITTGASESAAALSPIVSNGPGPTIKYVSDSGEAAKYEKFEVTFDVDTLADNKFFPYDPETPPGLPAGSGISVQATFTAPSGKSYVQPAFYFQEFDEQIKDDKAWFYPLDSYGWQVRFSPNEVGEWSYTLSAEDANGSATTEARSFSVNPSDSHGPIRVSADDPRYFEHEDGTYFPALGYNLNFKRLDWMDPHKNLEQLKIMQDNGIQLTRSWISQWSIYGSTWGIWFTHNQALMTQEPEMGLAHPDEVLFAEEYPDVEPPKPVPGSDVYLWLNFDERTFDDGNQWRFNPCRVFGLSRPQIPVKRNSNYRVRVRFQASEIIGPRVEREPVGFVVKSSETPLWLNESVSCYYPGAGTVLAATYPGDSWTSYPDPEYPGWNIIEGTFNSGERDFINFLYLAIENAKSEDPGKSAGHVFVDHVWIEEELGQDQFGPNVVYKPWMAHHLYINQRDAYAFDRVLELVEEHDVYLKAVMLDKNDYILTSLGADGTYTSPKSSTVFYGSDRESSDDESRVRWLQKAWWRYMQARWGYSANIHSWELLNEGPDNNDGGHWSLADEFGEYMHCGVFGIEDRSEPEQACTYDHPNDHLVTTSIWGEQYPERFWYNTSGEFNDLDYVDRHMYAREASTDPALFNDAALFTADQSLVLGAEQPRAPGMPVMRGETGWIFSAADLFAQDVSQGTWLHNMIWGGINPGGLIEHFWIGAPTNNQIYNEIKVLPEHDHRSAYGAFYRFIKDVPLNNGLYVDANAQSSNDDLRVWGQKDSLNGRAHLWIQNRNHTWKNVADGIPIAPANGTVTVAGLPAGEPLQVEWWDTYEGLISSTTTETPDESGSLVLEINDLRTDIAVKIGEQS